jgi:hypothetical protein
MPVEFEAQNSEFKSTARTLPPHLSDNGKSTVVFARVVFAHVLRHSGTRVLSHPVNPGNLGNLRPFLRRKIFVFALYL